MSTSCFQRHHRHQSDAPSDATEPIFGAVLLPNCASLTLDYSAFRLASALKALWPSIPVVDFTFRVEQDPTDQLAEFDERYDESLASDLGMPTQIWTKLRRVTFDGFVFYDRMRLEFPSLRRAIWHRQPLFTEWSFQELVVDLTRWFPTNNEEADYAELHLPLLFLTVEHEGYLKDIELRFPHELDARLQAQMKEQRRAKPNNPVRERLLPLMVMVGQDGEERKLLDMLE